MARVSVETIKSVIASLLNEQERDRENLLRMLAHCEKMIGHLKLMCEEEEGHIDHEANERKQSIRRVFGQLVTVEEERRERLKQHIADIEGQGIASERDNPLSLKLRQASNPLPHLKAVTKPNAA